MCTFCNTTIKEMLNKKGMKNALNRTLFVTKAITDTRRCGLTYVSNLVDYY